MTCILRIAIDTPLRRLFDYLPPTELGKHPPVGIRIEVPFGRRRVIGVLIEVTDVSAVPKGKLRRAHRLIDSEPVFDKHLFNLLQWSADYYRHPIGEVFGAALPGTLSRGAELTSSRECWQLNAEMTAEARQSISKRATRLHLVLNHLTDGNWHDASSLSQLHPEWRTAIRALEQRGYVQRALRPLAQPEPSKHIESTALALSSTQQAAVDRITTCKGAFSTLLLHGVTGSGKTEVYLQAIAAVLQIGQQALVLAPEIALTPQLVERFRNRFTAPVAVLHSGLNDGERLAAWRAARHGSAGIVIGTRSAIFTAFKNLGLIIVDEEHDASYKQQEGFRYSARDLAIARAQRHGIPVVLGSATPSLESVLRIKRKPEDLLSLPDRAGGAQTPTLKLVDLRQHAANQGLSTPVMMSIRKHLDTQGQVLLYLNRRGFAPVLFCPSCGWSAPCPRCDARLTVHQRRHKLICHHCAHEQPLKKECPACHAELKAVGQGTERIEETLQKIYPDAPLVRIDRDSVSRKGELAATLAKVHSGEAKLLVGTQMLSKGHHFPNVSLVVILDADQGLFSTEFRASERLAQSILQVAGRAGRGDRPGEVLIQTEYPDHPLLQRLLKEGYVGFTDAALQEREHAHWPPFARIALLRAEATALPMALQFLQRAQQLAKHHKKVRILGPAPAPMTRRAGMHRAQLLLHAQSVGPLQNLLAGLLPQLETLPETKKVRWSVDVDPIELF